MRHAVGLWVLCTLACMGPAARPTPDPAPRPPPVFTPPPGTAEAPVGFDGASNGMVDPATHLQDLEAFDEVEDIAGGLGPLFNAPSCRACHDTPVAGGSSQVTELRVGHLDTQGNFVTPEVSIGGGAAVVTGRSLSTTAPLPQRGLPRHRDPGARPGGGEHPRPAPVDQRPRRRLRRGGARPDADRHRQVAVPGTGHRGVRDGGRGAGARGPGHLRGGALRMEEPAGQPALVRRRRLPERDGRHQPAAPGRAHHPRDTVAAPRTRPVRRAGGPRPVRPLHPRHQAPRATPPR
jgi:hypothetical protein